MKTFHSFLCAVVAYLAIGTSASAENLTIAAASDLRFALDEVVEIFEADHSGHNINVIYGSSGRMTAQIINGAPYDILFSADISFPQRLQAEGMTATEPAVYAIGRIVLWSSRLDASSMTLQDLAINDNIRRIAIAQPAHAPYGQRAQEAMETAGVWEQIQSKLVFGENIAHAAQMTESGAADIGIIALSLALFPSMLEHGYTLISDSMHNPLTQGFVVTRRGGENALAMQFAEFMGTNEAHEIMKKYGFVMPGSQ